VLYSGRESHRPTHRALLFVPGRTFELHRRALPRVTKTEPLPLAVAPLPHTPTAPAFDRPGAATIAGGGGQGSRLLVCLF
jgi:hypothetical protein